MERWVGGWRAAWGSWGDDGKCDGSPAGQKVLSGLGAHWDSAGVDASSSPAAPAPPPTLPRARLTSVGIMEWLSRVRSFMKRILLGLFTKGLSSIVARPMNLERQRAGVSS